MTGGPLSAAQRRVWLADRIAGTTAVYVIPFGIRLRGRLDLSFLERALESTILLHPMLRVRIREHRGEPWQYIAPMPRLNLHVIDLSGSPARDREARTTEAAENEVRRPFMIHEGALHRISLVKLTELDHLLVWPIHHIACDGISIRLLMRDLATAYRVVQGAGFPEGPKSVTNFIDLASEDRSREAEQLAP